MATADQQPELFEPKPSRALPDPRLNPLLNPILAQHLGRWAHVYYTNPVEKREAAVNELVAELEAEAAKRAETSPGNPNRAAPAAPEVAGVTARQVDSSQADRGPLSAAPEIETAFPTVAPVEQASTAVRVETPSVEVPSDAQPKPPTKVPVNNDAESLVGQVGAWVKLPPEDSLREPLASVNPSQDTPSDDRSSHDLPSYDLLQEMAIAEPVRESVPEIAASVPVSSTASEDYRAFGEMLAKSDAAMELASFNSRRPARNWQIPLVATAVLVFVGVSFWVSRGGHARASDEAAHSIAPAIASAPIPTTPVSSASAEPRIVAQGVVAQGTVPPARDVGTNQTGDGLVITPPTPPLSNAADTNAVGSVPPSNIPPVEAPPVDPEMVAGMRALQGDGVPRDSAEAVRHFWQSAKNKNGSALVVLAGLYAQGDGVAKDCDQAKVLLDAAARQARSRTQAQRIESTRETLRNSGCE